MIFDSNKYNFIKNLYGNRAILLESISTKTKLIAKNNEYTYQEYKNLTHIQDIENIPEIVNYENGVLYTKYFEDTVSLYELIKDRNGPLDLEIFYNIAFGILDILEFIQLKEMIHKDINSSNILYNPTSKLVYLIDFELSSSIHDKIDINQSIEQLEGNIYFISPEQTGRINRLVDIRSDFYSLGVVFYNILCAKVPFVGDDMASIVYQHISKTPQKPHSLNSNIPILLSKFIEKLMEKEPENRYQSIHGIKEDLKRIEQNDFFTLGQKDFNNKLILKHSHYGREELINKIKNIFQNSIDNKNRLITIGGFSGTGKTSLVHELHKTLSINLGFYGESKFNQFNNYEPHFGFIKILNDYFKLILTLPSLEIKQFKEKVLSIFQSEITILTNKIPSLKQLVGEQKELEKLSLKEEEDRFYKNFIKLIKLLTNDKPLIFFIDDLQWADSGTIELIKRIALDDTVKNLTIINAYRDNEVDTHHIYIKMLNILQEKIDIDQFTISNLTRDDVSQLLKDMIDQDDSNLLEFIYNISGGNAFFIIQMIHLFNDQKLFTYDTKTNKFMYDLEKLKSIGLNNDVVQIATKNIQTLDKKLIDILTTAGAIGNKFNLELLNIVTNQKLLEDDLKEARKKHFIIKNNDNYSFSHDRLQQAFYILIDDDKKPLVHKDIALKLIQHKHHIDFFSNIDLEIATHYNLAIEILNDTEKKELVDLNLKVAKEIKDALAYSESLKYLNFGLNILDKNDTNLYWEYLYLKLEVYYNTSQISKMQEIIDILETLIDNDEKAVNLTGIVLSKLFIEGEHLKAIDYGVNTLSRLGLSIPTKANKLTVMKEFFIFKFRLVNRDFDTIVDIPEIRNKRMLLATRVLYDLIPPSYMTSADLNGTYSLIIANIAIKYGNSPYAAFGYGIVALLLGGVFKNFIDANKLGMVAIKVSEKYFELDCNAKTNFLYGSFIIHGTKDFKEYKKYKEISDKGFILSGNSLFRNYNDFFTRAQHIIFNDANLDTIKKESIDILNLYKKSNELPLIKFQIFTLAFIAKLQGNLDRVQEQYQYDEQLYMEHIGAQDNVNIRSIVYTFKSLENYLFGQSEDSFSYAKKAFKYVLDQQGLMTDHIFRMIYCLSYLQSNEVTAKDTLIYHFNKFLLKRYAKFAPMNFNLYYFIVLAQEAKKDNNFEKSEQYFQKALNEAMNSRSLFHIAFVNELIGKLWINRNKTVANLFLNESYKYYKEFKANEKANQLLETFNLNIKQQKDPKENLNQSFNKYIDIELITKATQALSQEIKTENLLTKMTNIILENLGANRGFIILNQDDNFNIVACVEDNKLELIDNKNTDDEENISHSVLNYTISTKEQIIIDNAIESEICIKSQYVKTFKPKSIVAIPMILNNQLKGILYCENNLITKAFSKDTVDTVSVILTQLIISLDNAYIYKNLENIVNQRTIELKESHEEIEKILNTTIESIFIFEDGKCKDANVEALKLFKYNSKKDVIGKLALDFIAEDSHNIVKEKLKLKFVESPYEADARRADGSTFPALIRGNDLKLKNKTIRIATLLDLTELKNKELLLAEQSRMAAMGEMIGNIAHQWRQPLSVISTAASGMRLQKEYDLLTDEELIENCTKIDENSQYLSKTIDDFRDFIKNNKEKKNFNIKDVINSSINIIQSMLTMNHITLVQNIDIDYNIEGYQNELSQAILNILNNSKDILTINNIEKKLIFISLINRNDNIVLQIKDNGGGIDDTIINKIFEPYFTTKHQSQGTGLGLYTVFNIIKKMNLNITVENNEYIYKSKNYKGALVEIIF